MMISSKLWIVVFLLLIESVVLFVSSRPSCKKYFSFLPAVFWIYFLPMIASGSGILAGEGAFYERILSLFLPASLALLLLSSDIGAILRLGPKALCMMVVGSLGIMAAFPLVFYLFKPVVGAQMGPGFGALSASWIGGSANMIAVKEATNTPDAVFAPMVIVDTVVPYVWMGLLVACAGLQSGFDRWNNSDTRVLEKIVSKVKSAEAAGKGTSNLKYIPLVLLITFLCTYIASFLAGKIPPVKDVISPNGWKIILVSLLAVGLSFTPVRRMAGAGAQQFGYFLLYFVLTTIGARANTSHLGTTFILILAGFLIVFLHALVLLAAARIMRAPLFLAAAASQANIGGVASAPVVAEIYRPGLASCGLLLAIFGNIIGTYCGIITSVFCRFLAAR